jgi:hypothetical protein
MSILRRQFFRFAMGATALPLLPRIVRAQAYPARPVRCIVDETDKWAKVIRAANIKPE